MCGKIIIYYPYVYFSQFFAEQSGVLSVVYVEKKIQQVFVLDRNGI